MREEEEFSQANHSHAQRTILAPSSKGISLAKIKRVIRKAFALVAPQSPNRKAMEEKKRESGIACIRWVSPFHCPYKQLIQRRTTAGSSNKPVSRQRKEEFRYQNPSSRHTTTTPTHFLADPITRGERKSKAPQPLLLPRFVYIYTRMYREINGLFPLSDCNSTVPRRSRQLIHDEC